jgi:hypothetical protein
MRKKIFTALTLMFFLFYFSLVFAQEGTMGTGAQKSPAGTYTKAPKTPTKVPQTPKGIFTAMDTNQDGRITKEEFMIFHMKFAKNVQENRFNQLDTNGDGMISKDEFSARAVKEAQFIGNLKFRFIDINNDKVITQQEVQKRFNALKQLLRNLSD